MRSSWFSRSEPEPSAPPPPVGLPGRAPAPVPAAGGDASSGRNWTLGLTRAQTVQPSESPPASVASSIYSSFTGGANRVAGSFGGGGLLNVEPPAQTLAGRTRSALGIENSQDFASTMCPSMTIKQRLIGFVICLGVGVFLDLCSFGRIAQAMRGRPERFAVMYTIGNITALAGTFFLAGPSRQCKRMMKQKRWVASVVFVSSMVLTMLVVQLHPSFHGRVLLILLLVLAQWCSLFWYGLTFIPGGPQLAWRVVRSCFCGDGA
mmetsp:Transcript_117025/g.294420  ORF Transcript_117025/g.294420 Transcript_117025/m.294420 type:complete len:263 (-) Transcript_117025:50-838(-)